MTPVTLRLRELREAKGMTQVDLAKAAGVRPATISDMENGKTQGIDFDTLDRLARALNVDPGFLIVREPAEGAKR